MKKEKPTTIKVKKETRDKIAHVSSLMADADYGAIVDMAVTHMVNTVKESGWNSVMPKACAKKGDCADNAGGTMSGRNTKPAARAGIGSLGA